MSNTAFIKQGTFTTRHNGDQERRAIFHDNYSSAHFNLDFYGDSFYDDDLELLQFIMGLVQSEDRPHARVILESIEENKCGLYINGEIYEWEQIQPLFEQYHPI
jgi:hypothetical protein